MLSSSSLLAKRLSAVLFSILMCLVMAFRAFAQTVVDSTSQAPAIIPSYEQPRTTSSLPSKLMLLERPGHKRVVFGPGSPIQFSFEDGEAVKGIIERVEDNAFFMQTMSGASLALSYKDVAKVVVPKDGRSVQFRSLVGGAMVVGAIGYMVLYALNPGAGNSIDPSKSTHAQTSWLVSGIATVAGLGLVYTTRDNRFRMSSGWRWRVDEADAHYTPYIQR